MVTFTFSGDTVADVFNQMLEAMKGHERVMISQPISQAKAAEILSQVGDDTPVGATSQDYAEPVHKEETAASPAPTAEKKTRTRRSKAEIEAEKKAKVEEPAEPEAAQFEPEIGTSVAKPAAEAVKAEPSKSVGKEFVHQALQQVNTAVNLAKAREILTQFGANKISDVKPEQYESFVDACNKAVEASMMV